MLRSYCRRWLLGLLVVSSGALMLTASSCSTIAQDVVGELATSVANQFVQNIIFQALGVSTSMSGLTT